MSGDPPLPRIGQDNGREKRLIIPVPRPPRRQPRALHRGATVFATVRRTPDRSLPDGCHQRLSPPPGLTGMVEPPWTEDSSEARGVDSGEDRKGF